MQEERLLAELLTLPKFITDCDVSDINISTEKLENVNQEKTNVSIIEILIEKSD